MKKNDVMSSQAKAIPRASRHTILMSFAEVQMHKYLKELFNKMEPDFLVEITHGPNELGKDLVIVKKDKISIEVIGVVVKCGDIKATTLGEVDKIKDEIKNISTGGKRVRKIEEISSQIDQAYKHKAELRSVFSKLAVTNVHLILVGSMSTNARERLDREIDEKVEIFDIDWLIDKFTDYYPQIYFEGHIVVFLQEKIEKIEEKFSLRKEAEKLTLSDYFIEPMVCPIYHPIKLDEDSLNLIFKEQTCSFSKISELASSGKKLILVGDPGTGKSSALAKLVLNGLEKAYASLIKGRDKSEKIKIPILLSAEEISMLSTFDEYLNYCFPKEELKDEFQIEVLCVDALDEVPTDKRQEIIDKAQVYADKLGCSLIITSRKVDIVKTQLSNYEKYELLPFEFGQAKKFFEKIAKSKEILNAVTEGLERIKSQVPMIPMSLILLVELAEKNKEIPASVTELYDRFIDASLGRYDMEKGIKVLFEYHVKKKFLADFAYEEFFKKNRLEVTKAEYQSYINTYSLKYGWELELMKTFFHELERSGIIEINDNVMFRHRSFLDYFVAFYIVENREKISDINIILTGLYFDDIWTEVAFFYVGLRRNVDPALLEMIFKHEDESIVSYMSKYSIGRLLQAGWNSEVLVKTKGIEEALKYSDGIREKYLLAFKGKAKYAPEIYAEFLMFYLSDFSFNSGFLVNEAKKIMDDLSQEKKRESITSGIYLLWSIKRFLKGSEIKKYIDLHLENITKMKNEEMLPKDKAKCLTLLMMIEDKNMNLKKIIKNRLEKIIKNSPQAFKHVFPSQKRVFKLQPKK